MEVLLDTNFIISCVNKRIDFLEELSGMGFKVIIPREVIEEMKDLKKEAKVSRNERASIDLAFEMIEKGKVKKMTLSNRKVDEGLIQKGREGIYIATLDRAIKNQIPNRVVINNAKNGLMVDRD